MASTHRVHFLHDSVRAHAEPISQVLIPEIDRGHSKYNFWFYLDKLISIPSVCLNLRGIYLLDCRAAYEKSVVIRMVGLFFEKNRKSASDFRAGHDKIATREKRNPRRRFYYA